MIQLTLLDDTPIVLNSDMIEFIEAMPDTIISLTNGKKMMVKESVTEVVDRIVAYRRRIGTLTREILPHPGGVETVDKD